MIVHLVVCDSCRRQATVLYSDKKGATLPRGWGTAYRAKGALDPVHLCVTCVKRIAPCPEQEPARDADTTPASP